jgi:hypothetical protein
MQQIAKNSPWNIDFLLFEYRTQVLPAIIRQCWSVDEMSRGRDMQEIEEAIWRGYEFWAEEQIKKNQIGVDQ